MRSLVVVNIVGLTPQLVDERMPNLQALASQGFQADAAHAEAFGERGQLVAAEIPARPSARRQRSFGPEGRAAERRGLTACTA